MENENLNNVFLKKRTTEEIINAINQKKAELEFLYKQTEQLKKEIV